MSDVKTVYVDELPDCGICKMGGKKEPAEYDAKMPGRGWANLCQLHFDQFGCRLGLGKGQKLIVRGTTKQPAEVLNKADELCRRCGKGCIEGSWNKETGRYRILDDPAKIEVMISLGLYCEEV